MIAENFAEKLAHLGRGGPSCRFPTFLLLKDSSNGRKKRTIYQSIIRTLNKNLTKIRRKNVVKMSMPDAGAGFRTSGKGNGLIFAVL